MPCIAHCRTHAHDTRHAQLSLSHRGGALVVVRRLEELLLIAPMDVAAIGKVRAARIATEAILSRGPHFFVGLISFRRETVVSFRFW
jgi:hypothetical protein